MLCKLSEFKESRFFEPQYNDKGEVDNAKIVRKTGDQYKMIAFIEKEIDLYYKIRDYALWVIFILSLFGVLSFWLNYDKNRRYTFNKMIQVIFASILDVCIGTLLYVLGVIQPIESVNFVAVVFMMIINAIILYMIIQIIVFNKIIRPILKNMVYFQYLIFVELFLLAITNHLDVFEFVTGVMVIILIYLMPEVLLPLEKKQGENVKQEESDFPNPKLYKTRQQQMDNFIPILQQQKKEPYAIMISGKWGSGKTSFVNALEKDERLKDDHFIWVYAGSEKTFSIVMSEISKKILEILQKNNVYIEHGNLIEEYFGAFAGVLEEKTGFKYLKKIANLCGTGENTGNKDYLNDKLGELKGTVYLVIDDLDRCDMEYKEIMFKVIRESTTALMNCKTIFLVDKEELCTREEQKKKHYIEKYIGYTLELCKVEYKDIFDYYKKIIFSDDFWCRMNPILLNGRNLDEIWKIMFQCPVDILGRYESECKEGEQKKKLSEEQKKIFEARRAELDANMINSRKIKNYLKGIRRNLENINIGVESCSQEYQKVDWVEAVIEVQCVKNILPELYDQMKQWRDITMLQEANMLFGINELGNNRNAKKICVMNEIVYNIDIIDFKQMMTEKEKYLSELHGNGITVDHINEYVKYAESYEDLKKIVMICKEHSSLKGQKREAFLENILDRMCNQYEWIAERKEDFLELSKMIIGYLSDVGMSEQEKKICEQKGHIIGQKIIAINGVLFQYILKAFFSFAKVENAWHVSQPLDIDDLYKKMKDIDSNNIYIEPKNYYDSFTGVKNGFDKMKETLLNGINIESRVDFEKKFEEIDLILENCQYWQEIDKKIEQINRDDLQTFTYFFSLSGAVNNETVYHSIETLLEALTELKKFYAEMADDYQLKYNKILEGISYRIVSRYEEDPDWFKDRESEVGNLLAELEEQVYSLVELKENGGVDQVEKKDANEILDCISLCIFKFKRYIESKNV